MHLRDFLVTKVERLKSHAELSMHGIIYALLSETFEALTIIDSSIKVKVNNPAIEPELYVQSVIDRQKQMALKFRQLMTEDQSFEGVNSYWEQFYRRVIRSAEEVSFHNLFHLCK